MTTATWKSPYQAPEQGTLDERIDALVEDIYAGHKAAARKAGRNPKLPYVPIVKVPTDRWCQGYRTQQIMGLAYATRDEAVAVAQRNIDNWKTVKKADLRKPNHQAERECHGLPRVLPDDYIFTVGDCVFCKRQPVVEVLGTGRFRLACGHGIRYADGVDTTFHFD